MAGSTDNNKQVAKELTIAAINKIPIIPVNGKVDHQKYAQQIGEIFEVIYTSVKKD